MKPDRLIFLLLLSLASLFGLDFSEANASYRIRFGVIGEIGDARAVIKISDGTYKIRLEARSKGIAKLLSRNRREIYESTGSYEKGLLVPHLFVKRISRGGKTDIKRYFFDHEKKAVNVVISHIEEGKKTDTTEALAYYATNDILSLYFNLQTILAAHRGAEKITLKAVGANKRDGHLDLILPEERRRAALEKLVGEKGRLLVAILHQKIFSSDRGELVMLLDGHGICTRAVLKDVIWFGDITGEIKSLSIE